MRRPIVLAFIVALTVLMAGCAPATVGNGFAADLTASAEFPAPTLDGATPSGSATAVLDSANNTLTLSGTFSGLTGPATGAHIHGPAGVGETAGVLFPLQVDTAASGSISGTWTDMTAEQVRQLRDGLYYVNIHTEMNAAGEIRGQLR
ncbi:MAG: CHRD domain-containing protein [Trueperaceae bacterium]